MITSPLGVRMITSPLGGENDNLPTGGENDNLPTGGVRMITSSLEYSINKTLGVCMTNVTVITPAECTRYANYSFN